MSDFTVSSSLTRRLGARIWSSRVDYLFLIPGMLIFGGDKPFSFFFKGLFPKDL